MTVLVTVEAVVLGLLTYLAIGLLRSHADILRQLRQLDPGAPRPGDDRPLPRHVRGQGTDGQPVEVAVAGTGADTLLAFLSSGCTTCGGLWEALGDPTRVTLGAGVRVVVVTRGPEGESVSAIRGRAAPEIPVVMSSEAWDAYRVPGSPYVVLVDGESGRVLAEGRAERWEEAQALTTRRGPTDNSHAGRRARVDAELLGAGIGPGHPSLHPDGRTDDERAPS